jgi:L-aspartate oxidase
MEIRNTDILIIGCGIAGLTVADGSAMHKHVTIITKSTWKNSNSILAQGGIAGVVDDTDHWSKHLTDTVTAGHNHNDEQITEYFIKQGSQIVKELVNKGVSFDRSENGDLLLAQEGGHSKRRILHAGGDATGRAIVEWLNYRVAQNVTIHENKTAIDLEVHDNRCVGAWVQTEEGKRVLYLADHVVIATGGAGSLYSVTSNDQSVTGDGIAMAYRAGAQLGDMEFMQFHPTMLYHNNICYGLVSEAVRGEGARLRTETGRPIMQDIHPLEDLAPRDIVAKTVYQVIQKGEKVFLDISAISHFEARFPTISSLCHRANINLENQLLPISPGAHFLMGGIVTDEIGKTSIPGLYTVGEAACTGVHGANRLASNSLLEALTFGSRVAADILSQPSIRNTDNYTLTRSPLHKYCYLPMKEHIQTVMSEHVAIVRNGAGLKKAKLWFEQWKLIFNEERLPESLDGIEIERANMLTVGWLITTSALLRTESRGGHYREDYPVENKEEWLKRRILRERKADESIKNAPALAAIF